MTNPLQLSRPTKIIPPCTDNSCDKLGLYRMGSDYPCSGCSDYTRFVKHCRQFCVNPKTLLSLPIPAGCVVLWRAPIHEDDSVNGLKFVVPESMTDLLVDGFEFVAHDIYYKRDEGFVEANPSLSPGLEMPVIDKVIVAPTPVAPALSFTREDIEAKLDEHYKFLDHAFALLGKDATDPKGPRSRFARFVTGDFKDEGKNFRSKSLQHKTAGRCFYRFIKDTEWKTHLELARQIVLDNWTQLEELLEAECYALPKVDDVWLDKAVITGMSAKAFQVEGWGWLPKSKIKFIKGKMVIPAWLAQSVADKEEK